MQLNSFLSLVYGTVRYLFPNEFPWNSGPNFWLKNLLESKRNLKYINFKNWIWSSSYRNIPSKFFFNSSSKNFKQAHWNRDIKWWYENAFNKSIFSTCPKRVARQRVSWVLNLLLLVGKFRFHHSQNLWKRTDSLVA